MAATLPRPDPDRPTPGNRRVKLSHAQSFADYVRENENWVAPALLLRAPDIFTFEAKETIEGTQFGILGLPRLARTDLRILDGQHRILGLHLAVDDIAAELAKQRDLRAAARREGDVDLERHFDSIITKLDRQRVRLSRERISIQIHIEEDSKAYEQMFVDIADNALGITSAIRARFDSRKIVNRVLEDVMKHPLLANRVDMEMDRVGGSSPCLMGAKHVADITRTVAVGITGRVGRRQEMELHEDALVEQTNSLLDALVNGFPELDKLIEGTITAEELRRTSLLGSTTMLRILAGAYHELVKDLSDDEIGDFFSSLAPFMKARIPRSSPWLATGVFTEGATAPKARRQDLESLTRQIVNWARVTPDWLRAA